MFKFHFYTKKRPHKVIPSDNSMHAGNEQLFDRSGEFFTTKIEHTHGTSTDIGCSLVALQRGLSGKTPRVSDLVAAHIMTHLHLLMYYTH